jgi:hypothetical protein
VRLRHKGGRDEFFRAETETMADSWVIVGQRGTVGTALARAAPRVHAREYSQECQTWRPWE